MQCQQDAWEFLNYFKALYGNKSLGAPTIILAAKAVEVFFFFFRIIRKRTSSAGASGKGDAALMDMVNKFQALRYQGAYKQYMPFFESTEQIMDSLYTVEALQEDILRHLFPLHRSTPKPGRLSINFFFSAICWSTQRVLQ